MRGIILLIENCSSGEKKDIKKEKNEKSKYDQSKASAMLSEIS